MESFKFERSKNIHKKVSGGGHMYTSGQKGLHIHSFMEQTTLITGIVGGAGIDPPP